MIRGLHAGTHQDVKAALLAILGSFPTPSTSSGVPNSEIPESSASSQEDTSAAPTSTLTQETESAANADSSTSGSVETGATQIEAGGRTDSPPRTPDATRETAVQRLLAERRVRLEKQKKAQEAKDKAERKAKAEARNAAAAAADSSSSKGQQATWVQQQKERKAEAQRERERILRQIEHDKQERKERSQWSNAAKQGVAEKQDEGNSRGASHSTTDLASTSSPKDCSLQVRLLDGKSIRKKFSSDHIFGTHVRPWIDENRSDGDVPYTLKVILSPWPNKPLSDTDEEQSLHDLKLAPSSSLVLVPIQGFSNAYPRDPSLMSRIFFAVFNAIGASVTSVLNAFRTFLGIGQALPYQHQRSSNNEVKDANAGGSDERSQAGLDSGTRVRTLFDQRRDHEKNEFYNGNQV